MPVSNRSYDLNMERVGDEELVVLAKECRFRPARDELILRFRDRCNRLIWRRAGSRCVPPADVEDAQQDAVFWVVEAIERYDTRQIGIRNGCSFRTFLFRVLTARFLDFLKHLRRAEGRCQLSAALGTANARLQGGGPRQDDGPLMAASERESAVRLQQALTDLGSTDRQLWAMMASGMKLSKIADERGVSYDVAKYERRKLLADLNIRLREQDR